MAKKLKSMVPGTFSYSVGKIYEGIYNPYPLTKINFDTVKSSYEEIRDEIDRRYNIRTRQGVADITRRIDYILSRVETWILNNELLNNMDAEVFMDAFSAHFEEFEEMLDEMDSE